MSRRFNRAARAWLAIGCALTAVSAPAAGHRGRVVGSVAGGSTAHSATGVTAIDASTGAIAAAGHIVPRSRFHLKVAPGVYHVAVSIVPAHGDTLGGLGPLVAVTAGRVRADIQVSAKQPATLLALVPSAETVSASSVATMGDVTVQNPPGFAPASITAPLLTPLFNRTQKRCKLRWVDQTRRFLDQRARELELQREGRLDPSTPVRDELIMPTLRVEGSFVNDLERIMGELRLVDIASGQVILRRPFSGRTPEIERLIESWGDEFGRAMCPTLTETTMTQAPVTSTSSTTMATTTTTMPGAACTSSSQCGPEDCCSPDLGHCCTVGASSGNACAGDAIQATTFYGCCYNDPPGDPQDIPPGTCGGGAPAKCPARCEVEQFYSCALCKDDSKFVSHFGF